MILKIPKKKFINGFQNGINYEFQYSIFSQYIEKHLILYNLYKFYPLQTQILLSCRPHKCVTVLLEMGHLEVDPKDEEEYVVPQSGIHCAHSLSDSQTLSHSICGIVLL